MTLSGILPDARSVVPNALARPRAAAIPEALPDIEPGALWLIEVSAEESAASALLRRVIGRANVVIYDRILADIVAGSLPLGSYAEAAASSDDAADPAAGRAAGFARDGWAVARLVPARPTQRERLVRIRRLVEELAATRAPGEVAVTVLGELSDGVCEPTETRLNRLDQVVVTYPRDARLTIVVGGIGRHTAARLHAVAGNGLAG